MEQAEARPTVTIKLKPHLQEYLRCKLQEEEILATKRSLIGVMLRPFLEIRPKGTAPDFSCGDNFMTFRLPKFNDLNVRNGTVYISKENQDQFERILDAHFKDMFFSYLDDKVRYMREQHTSKGAIKKCILQFCADFHISYNRVTYEMLKKAYYRRSTEQAEKRSFFSSKLSLTCPLLFLI